MDKAVTETPTCVQEAIEAVYSGQVWPAQVITKLDARGMGLGIKVCGACGASHEGLVINEYARQSGPFTHWFMCPTLHDPVGLTLGMLQSGEGLEFDGAVIQSLAQAQLAGMYMVIIASVDQTKERPLVLIRHGHKFPTGDIYESKESKGLVGLLMQNLADEFGPPQPVEMPKVSPKPLKTLMGDSEPKVPVAD